MQALKHGASSMAKASMAHGSNRMTLLQPLRAALIATHGFDQLAVEGLHSSTRSQLMQPSLSECTQVHTFVTLRDECSASSLLAA